MNQYKQPLFTIFVIFATAYMLSIMGCAPAGNDPVRVSADNGQTTPTKKTYKPVDVNSLSECTASEWKKLLKWSDALDPANKSIIANGAEKKNSKTLELVSLAVGQCKASEYYHEQNPCKKTDEVVDIVSQKIKTTVRVYDAYSIDHRCDGVRKYFEMFRSPDTTVPTNPNQPTQPINPPVTPIDIPDQPIAVEPNPIDNNVGSGLRDCSKDEFAKLVTWRADLDRANKSIAKLGTQTNWKYEPLAVDSSAAATKACENLIVYHAQNECQRKVVDEKTKTSQIKVYTGDSLREQCSTARSYNYEFLQQSESLIVKNASLLLDVSPLANQNLSVGQVDGRIGEQCFVSNLTDSDVVYNNGQEVLLTAARVYPPKEDQNLQMFVMETEQGIKIECYGLDYTSVKTSKTEVIRLLEKKNTSISLRYILK